MVQISIWPHEDVALVNKYKLAPTVCDNTTSSFRFIFVYTERSNRLNGRSVSFVCLTAFWQNGGKTIV